MLETSKDLLFVVLAASIGLLSILTAAAIFYVVVMLRHLGKITANLRGKMELIDKILKLVKEKLEKGSDHMALIADSAIKLVGFMMDKQKSGSARRKKK